MHSHPRPITPTVHSPRLDVPGRCPECGLENLSSYRVISENGWWNVVKCQNCLASVSRERGPMFGAFTPLGAPK